MFREERPPEDKPPFITAHKIPPLEPVKYESLPLVARAAEDKALKHAWVSYFKIPDRKHSLKGQRFENMGKCHFCDNDGKIAHYKYQSGRDEYYYCKRCAKQQLDNGLTLTGLQERAEDADGLLGMLRKDEVPENPFRLVFKPLGKHDRVNLGEK